MLTVGFGSSGAAPATTFIVLFGPASKPRGASSRSARTAMASDLLPTSTSHSLVLFAKIRQVRGTDTR
jgi:hypothetical protein